MPHTESKRQTNCQLPGRACVGARKLFPGEIRWTRELAFALVSPGREWVGEGEFYTWPDLISRGGSSSPRTLLARCLPSSPRLDPALLHIPAALQSGTLNLPSGPSTPLIGRLVASYLPSHGGTPTATCITRCRASGTCLQAFRSRGDDDIW